MMLWMWSVTESLLVSVTPSILIEFTRSIDDWRRFELAYPVLVREQYLRWLGRVECEIILSWPSFYTEQFCGSDVNILRWDDDVSIVCVFADNVARRHCSQIRSRESYDACLMADPWIILAYMWRDQTSDHSRPMSCSGNVHWSMQPASCRYCPGCQAWRISPLVCNDGQCQTPCFN